MSATAQFATFGPYQSNGRILTGIQIYHYEPGTSTEKDAYQDAGRTIFAGQPIFSNANGMAWGFFDGLYKIVVADELGTPLYTWDNWGVQPTGTVDWINVQDLGALGDGASDDAGPIGTALAVSAANGKLVYFPRGTYAYATSPNFAQNALHVWCEKGTIFKHTGTGVAFNVDGGATGSGVFGLRFDNVRVQGNSNSTHGWYVRAVHHSLFTHPSCIGCATTGAAFQLEWCVANQWDTPRCSVNEAALSPVPLYGMTFTRRGSGSDYSSANLVLNPVMEGLTNGSGAGLYLDYSTRTSLYGGTSESNVYGLYLTANTSQNVISGLDLESNSTEDIHCLGFYNTFTGINATGITHLLQNFGNNNTFLHGFYNSVTVDSQAIRNAFLDVVYGSAGGVFLNNESTTYKRHVFNATTTQYDADSPDRFMLTRFQATYGPTVAIDAGIAAFHLLVPTDAVNFTLAAPTNGGTGQSLTIMIKNMTGGSLGIATWTGAAGGYRLGAAWTQPASAFSRSITFHYDGTNWIEQSRTAADVQN